jgi:hypothetical protein
MAYLPTWSTYSFQPSSAYGLFQPKPSVIDNRDAQSLTSPLSQDKAVFSIARFSSETFSPALNRTSPYQAGMLFVGGVLTAVALGVIFKTLKLSPLQKMAKELPQDLIVEQAAKQGANLRVEHQISNNYQEGLIPAVINAVMHPGAIANRLYLYLASSVVGYAVGSILDSVQEVWVRREETLTRLHALKQLQVPFQKSFQKKIAIDNALRITARNRIKEMLNQCGLKQFDVVLDTLATTNFWNPFLWLSRSATPSTGALWGDTLRFGFQASPDLQNAAETMPASSVWNQKLVKSAVFVLGMMTGGVVQGFMALGRIGAEKLGIQHLAQKNSNNVLYLIRNVAGLEGLFMFEAAPVVLAIVGLSAAARLGKSLFEGYRQIEVTRQHGLTELTFQTYNWEVLDPQYHQLAENAALSDQLSRFKRALPFIYSNVMAMNSALQTLFGSIGNNSGVKAMAMTPSFPLQDARS